MSKYYYKYPPSPPVALASWRLGGWRYIYGMIKPPCYTASGRRGLAGPVHPPTVYPGTQSTTKFTLPLTHQPSFHCAALLLRPSIEVPRNPYRTAQCRGCMRNRSGGFGSGSGSGSGLGCEGGGSMGGGGGPEEFRRGLTARIMMTPMMMRRRRKIILRLVVLRW